ncbi:hypothetical protein CC1G_01389 [Coprinopsis cinerea okayama7|uniref:Thioredoxin domain-containing protein n=1 Tax=Coprinopsis cinerea (strain Okayama-7 / 130 / ATCC MYA-4618 / FGSC 9003) TaxID=240176 RepID=A8NYN6_COPC7|nr:hypothetical protein CC1G_01389 [Coprinopsis cinerea okayama7\|eukprot:XP_001837477.1 hypothetical protein CC1G_01389 [Coprinopsis cinerea okayama7\
MKFSNIALGVLAFGGLSARAQYFSEGWKPGQPVHHTVAEAEATYAPGGPIPGSPQVQQQQKGTTPSPVSLLQWLDPEKLLSSVLKKAGFNMTGVGQSPWDERIPLITDDNYHDVIVNETFESEDEERDRVWALVVTVSANRQEPLSKIVDEMFDSAYNKTLEENDLPHVRWGRIDYFNVTYITTKWNVWKAPYIILLQDRGQTLHFFRPGNMRIDPDALREFLKTEGYKTLPPWSSIWAPGGDREWILDLFAVWMTKAYNITTKVPRWILFILSGGLASTVLSFLHKPSKTPAAKPKKVTMGPQPKTGDNINKEAADRRVSDSTTPAATPTPKATTPSESVTQKTAGTPSPAKRSSARQRKGKKSAA